MKDFFETTKVKIHPVEKCFLMANAIIAGLVLFIAGYIPLNSGIDKTFPQTLGCVSLCFVGVTTIGLTFSFIIGKGLGRYE